MILYNCFVSLIIAAGCCGIPDALSPVAAILRRHCWPECDEGYHVPERNSMLLSCEGGKWLTDDVPYNGDNVCFPERGYICPYEIPNGLMPEKYWRRMDNGESRGFVSVKCDDSYRVHRTMRWPECVAGEWVTGQERFGLNMSNICYPYPQ